MMNRAGLDLGLGLGLGLASQGSLTSSTTTASSSPSHSHWTAALSSVVGAPGANHLAPHEYVQQQRKEEPAGRTSTSPESGVSAGTKRGLLERTGSGVSRGGAGSDEDDDGAGGRKKLRLSKDQAAVLEECFKTHSTLNPKQKSALANRLGLRPRQVEVWFQNRRARTKLKQTEVDCEYMKRCCEQLAEQNKRLEKEVAELRALKAAPAAHQAAPAATLTMCPSCRRVAATNTAAGLATTAESHQQQQQCHPKPNAQSAGNVLPSHCQFFPVTANAGADRPAARQGTWNGAAQPLVTRELF